MGGETLSAVPPFTFLHSHPTAGSSVTDCNEIVLHGASLKQLKLPAPLDSIVGPPREIFTNCTTEMSVKGVLKGEIPGRTLLLLLLIVPPSLLLPPYDVVRLMTLSPTISPKVMLLYRMFRMYPPREEAVLMCRP